MTDVIDSSKKEKKVKKEKKDKKESKKPKLSQDENNNEEYEIDDSTLPKGQVKKVSVQSMSGVPVTDFKISPQTIAALKKRGIETLFPIQASTFEHIRQGNDLIGRARTGQGKTLAFCLPILEQLISKGTIQKGTHPKVVIMSPTRELARQISEEFSTISSALRIQTFYGGTSLQENYAAISKGIDVVVGTPGRIKDLLERNKVRFDMVEHVVLDEADQMLDMGFQDDISYIIESVKDRPKQVLLFSATMPSWVHKIANKYMSQSRMVIDLVGEGDHKAVTTIRHVAIPYNWETLGSTLNDVVSMYAGRKGKVIVFCATKADCDTIAMDSSIKHECHVIHGDIAQAKRETTLLAFKNGSFRCLIATDVAARGLDLSVELVIQVKPPIKNLSGVPDTENYVHRSGRTGRAGKSGVCVTLYGNNTRYAVQEIERVVGNKFEWLGAPQPMDVVIGCADQCIDEMKEIDDNVLSHFKSTAKSLLSTYSPEKALCAALALLTGCTSIPKSRSLLNSNDGFVSVEFHSKTPIQSTSYVFGALNRNFNSEVTRNIRGMRFSKDRCIAVFDVPEEHIPIVKETITNIEGYEWLKICTEIPQLAEDDNNGFSRGSSGRGGGRGGGGRGGGRGFGGRSSGRSSGRFNSNSNNSTGFKRKREFE
eukprot:gene18680-24428_t